MDGTSAKSVAHLVPVTCWYLVRANMAAEGKEREEAKWPVISHRYQRLVTSVTLYMLTHLPRNAVNRTCIRSFGRIEIYIFSVKCLFISINYNEMSPMVTNKSNGICYMSILCPVNKKKLLLIFIACSCQIKITQIQDCEKLGTTQ